MGKIQKIAKIVKKGEEDNISEWLNMPAEKKLAIQQYLREEYMRAFSDKLKGRIERDETGKRLRRVYRIVKRT